MPGIAHGGSIHLGCSVPLENGKHDKRGVSLVSGMLCGLNVDWSRRHMFASCLVCGTWYGEITSVMSPCNVLWRGLGGKWIASSVP